VSGRLRSWLTAFDGKPLRRGIAAASVVALMATGTGVAYAAWTASVTATSTASAATLTVTTSNVNSLAATFGNEAIASAGSVSLTSTGSVTVANTTTTTSTTVPALTLTLSSASGTLASAVNATVWYQANGVCTAATAVGAGSVTGAWSGPVVLTSTLAKGVSATYCVRSTIADRQDAAIAAGAQSFVPQVSAKLTVGNFTGTASAQSSTAQATRSLFPVAAPTATSWYKVKRATTELCMDVSGGGGTTGTAVITYTCKTTGDFTNQEWQFTQDSTSGYFDIKPRSAQTLRVDAQSGSVAVVTDGAAVTQLWQPQLVAAGVYQFVNKSTGLCLVSAASSGTTAMSLATCDNSASQRFSLTETATGATGSLQGLACQDYTNATNISITWTGNGLGPYRTQVQRNGTWYLLNTGTSAWQSNAEIQGSSVPTGSNPGPLTGWPDGTYPMRIIDSSNNVVGSGLSVEVYSITQWWVFTTTYVRCG
jgi:hypothetical protein